MAVSFGAGTPSNVLSHWFRSKWQVFLKWPYLDMPLWSFTLLMVSAAAITSHGTFTFYRYIMGPLLALFATVVITVGIPLLELAAVLDQKHRGRWVTGMIVFLTMEGFAQYFQGQAFFLARVKESFLHAPDGIDLVWMANDPVIGRVLPIVYLAILSGIVVYFGLAASQRFHMIRSGLIKKEEETFAWADLNKKLGAAQRLRSEQDVAILGYQEKIQQQSNQIAEMIEFIRKGESLKQTQGSSESSLRKAIDDLKQENTEYKRLLAEQDGFSREFLAQMLHASGRSYDEIMPALGIKSKSTISKWINSNGHVKTGAGK